jgi:aldehyde dehydrogenase (NAD+)
VGESGMGQYHGKAGFDTFSHCKGIVNKSTKIDFDLRYRPYDQKKAKMIRSL